MGKLGIPKQQGRNNYPINRTGQDTSNFERNKSEFLYSFPEEFLYEPRISNVKSKNKITRRKHK